MRKQLINSINLEKIFMRPYTFNFYLVKDNITNIIKLVSYQLEIDLFIYIFHKILDAQVLLPACGLASLACRTNRVFEGPIGQIGTSKADRSKSATPASLGST
jgi:hypothetical protein